MREVRVGEIVLIGDDNRKRLDWPLGKVLNVYTGKDGHCRVVRVKTQNGELVRPVQRIYPLELPESIREEVVGSTTLQAELASNEDVCETREPMPVSTNKEEVVKTRRGRTVKKPRQLDL